MVGVKIIYHTELNPCCEKELNPCCENEYKSQEELLKEKAHFITLWVVDDDCDLNKVWGDDWDDRPACCNAGSPYEDTCKGLRKIELKLGEKIEIK